MSAPFAEVNAARTGSELASEFGLTPARERYKFACVSCDSADALHAYSDQGSGLYCFSCGKSFSAIDVGVAIWGLTPLEACHRLAERFGIRPGLAVPIRHGTCVEPTELAQRTKAEVLGEIISELGLGPVGRAYLEGRGLSPDFALVQGFRSLDTPQAWSDLAALLIARWSPTQLKAAGFPVAHGRVWLPWKGSVPALAVFYFGRGGRQVESVRFRRMTEGPKKYMALCGPGTRVPWRPEAFDGPRPLELVAVEGELDALSLLQEGYESIALGGATPSGAVIDWIVEACADVDTLALWMDHDASGEGAVDRLAQALADRYGTDWVSGHVVQWRSNRDANDLLALAGGLQ